MRLSLLVVFAALTSPVICHAENLKCSDFRQNLDGSWTSLRAFNPITSKDASEGRAPPGLKLTEGSTIDGIDVAATLRSRCR